MSRAIVAASLTLGLLAGVPASGLAGGIEVRGGGFAPRAESNLFSDVSELYNVDKKDWAGGTGGVEFSMKLVPNLEIGFHVDGYNQTLDSHYRSYTRENDREIFQTLELNVVPVGVSLRLVPTSRHARLAPYATVGADLFLETWEPVADAGPALEALAGETLRLQMISSRGTMIWPATGLTPDEVGLMRCRYVARENGAPVSDAEIAALVGRVGEQYAWTHIEKLHVFAGEPGYTKAQGQ